MSTTPDEKKEAAVEGDLTWSGVRLCGWVYFLASSTSFHHSSLSSRLGLGGGTGIPFAPNWWGVVFPMVTLTMSTYQIHTDTEWRFFKVVGRVLAAVLTLTACYIHALTVKHAVTPKFWHGFHPKQT